MSAEKTRFRKIKLDELRKILPPEAISGNNHNGHDQETKKMKDRAASAKTPKGNSP